MFDVLISWCFEIGLRIRTPTSMYSHSHKFATCESHLPLCGQSNPYTMLESSFINCFGSGQLRSGWSNVCWSGCWRSSSSKGLWMGARVEEIKEDLSPHFSSINNQFELMDIRKLRTFLNPKSNCLIFGSFPIRCYNKFY